LKSYADNYQGKRRYIDGTKCITATDFDSTIVRYKRNWINNVYCLVTEDSIIFYKNSKNHFSEIEYFARKNPDGTNLYFKKDFGLELRYKLLKSITEQDSALYYKLPELYDENHNEKYDGRSNIDFSKCSCDSIAKYYSLLDKIDLCSYTTKVYVEDITITSSFEGYIRTIQVDPLNSSLTFCTYVNTSDSIVVNYTSNQSYSWKLGGIDYRTLPKIVPYDSSVYHKGLNNKIEFSEHYKWGYNPFVKDNHFRFDLEQKIIKSNQGKDSAFTGYYEPVHLLYEDVISKKDSNRLSMSFEPVLRVYYTQDDSGYYHGKFISYRENGKLNENVTYKHGVIDSYYYYNDGKLWCSCSGRFADGIQRGRWRYKYYPIFRRPHKETLWFTKNGKIYEGRIIPIKKVSDEYIEILCGEPPASKIIDGFFNIINIFNR
jgi:antitoxin component YwqK of YwqJK toxin-antitoxin module